MANECRSAGTTLWRVAQLGQAHNPRVSFALVINKCEKNRRQLSLHWHERCMCHTFGSVANLSSSNGSRAVCVSLASARRRTNHRPSTTNHRPSTTLPRSPYSTLFRHTSALCFLDDEAGDGAQDTLLFLLSSSFWQALDRLLYSSLIALFSDMHRQHYSENCSRHASWHLDVTRQTDPNHTPI